jgi:CrcB protein
MIRGVQVDRRELLAILLGGFFGALARAELEQALGHAGGTWPWATLIVNVAGALVLGYVVTRLQDRLAPTAYWRPLLGTGFCGALTTFSTMQLELLQMLDHDRVGLALGYALCSIAAGFAGVTLASKVVRRAAVAP